MTASPLTRALGYSKFAPGKSPRLMVMKSRYFVVEDVLQSAREMGWELLELPTALGDKGESSFLTGMLKALVEFRPDFVLTINHIGFDEEGVLAGILNEFGIPLASWFVDHPLPILAGAEKNALENTQVFCFEQSVLPWLARIGFEDPVHLPTASNARHFHPRKVLAPEAARLGTPLTLVAGSWWQKARESFSKEVRALAREMGSGQTIDRHFLRDQLDELFQSYGDAVDRDQVLASQAALAETSMRKRADFVIALAELGPVVYGDAHWHDMVLGIDVRSPVHPTRELPSLYAGSQVNLNVTAEQMPTAVNQRVWDVPGVGAFLLTDAQDDVLEHFEDGRDVVVYHSLDEAVDKARHYLAHESARKRIAAKGLETIERAHRTHHRLTRMEEVMRARFGGVGI